MSLTRGISAFSEGIGLAKSRQVRPYIVLPAAVSLVIITLGLYFGLSYLTNLAASLSQSLPEWLSFIEVIIAPVLYVVGILAGAWLFGFLATIIGSPFLGELAKAVENPALGEDTSFMQTVWGALGRELRKMRYHLPRLLGLFLLGFIPVVNAVAPFAWLVFGAWLMAVQFCDFSTENNQQSFQTTLDTLRRHRISALGFGACVTLAMAVPILNFIVGPVAAAGGTRLMMELKQGQLKDIP